VFPDGASRPARSLALTSYDPDELEEARGGSWRGSSQARRAAITAFNSDPAVRVMVANDAAGEGVNLQRGAHLVVNYDLPWNPVRIEQRLGAFTRSPRPSSATSGTCARPTRARERSIVAYWISRAGHSAARSTTCWASS
jgi:hypothetical protein